MKDFLTPFKVGLVVIGAIVAFFIMNKVVDQGIDETKTYKVEALFDDVTGLSLNGRVQLAGIKVGEIREIDLVEGKAIARVVVELEDRVVLYRGLTPESPGGVWRDGATIVKKQASLVGDYYLDLTPGLRGEALKDGEEIKNVPKLAGFDSLFAKLDVIAGDISKVTNSLAETFGSDEGKASLKSILARLENIATTMSDFLNNNRDNFSRIVTNTEETTANVSALTRNAQTDIRKILTDAQAISRDLRYIIAQSGSDVREGVGNFKDLLARLSRTLDTLNYSLQNVSEITDKINEGEGTLGALVNERGIADETEAMLSGINGLVEPIDRLQTIVELRSDYLFRQAALKNFVSLRLQPNPQKYYLIELVDDPRGNTSLLQTTTSQTDPSAPPIVREEKVITTDDFKFSAMVARRWGFFTGRFGLIETTGGVGGDLHFLQDDALEIRFDLFDFGEDVNPRLRTTFSYTPIEFLYLNAGSDDWFNDQTRDFFFGFSLRFNDRDLKAILPFAPSP